MKSMARTLLQCVLALALLLFAGAQAEGGAEAKDLAVFRIDQCVPGGQYAFFLMAPGADSDSLSGENLYYVDQLQASGSEMSVAAVLPGFTACDAYAGGVFADDSASPRKLGSYTAARTPAQLAEIGASAFEGSAFTHVILGENVTTIGSRAFADCQALAYIYLPGSVESIAEDAFDGSEHVIIGCSAGSAAETFAKEYGIEYQTPD